MYRTCLHCLSTLGDDEVAEGLPAGGTIVFDPERERVWVVCPACARWNLAPLTDRRATLATAERLYAEAHGHVERDGIGLCRLPDGTTLVRIGAADEKEVAAWRYGTELRTHRPQSAAARFARTVGALVAGTLLSPGVVGRFRVIHVLDGTDGARVPVRRSDLDGGVFRLDTETGRLRVALAEWAPKAAARLTRTVAEVDAGVLFDRMLISVNREGATPNTLAAALRYLEQNGAALVGGLADTSTAGSSGFLRVRYEGEGAWRGEWSVSGSSGFLPVPRHRTLALEMARQADAERIAAEGELRALELRWKEAEELARLADEL